MHVSLGFTITTLVLRLRPQSRMFIDHKFVYHAETHPAQWVTLASFPGLQSPNAVEGLVKLLRRMTSGRRWVYIRVDVWRRGTSGEVQSAAR